MIISRWYFEIYRVIEFLRFESECSLIVKVFIESLANILAWKMSLWLIHRQTFLRVYKGLHWHLKRLEIFRSKMGRLRTFHAAEWWIQFLGGWWLWWSEFTLFRKLTYVLRLRHGSTECISWLLYIWRKVVFANIPRTVNGSTWKKNLLLNWPDLLLWHWFRSKKLKCVSYALN